MEFYQPILETMLKRTASLKAERYSEYLHDEAGLSKRLRNLLRNSALADFESKGYNRDSLLSIGGARPEGSGAYLHILWLERDLPVYLYVGQSQEAKIRIQNHNDPDCRKGHPSLHYFVWEKLGSNLSLNLLEMWCALILQTLPKDTLMQYLPCETLSPRAGCHLNIGSPLSQMVDSDGPEASGLGDIFTSDDPSVWEFINERRRQYAQLRHSDDPMFRDYWWGNFRRGLKTSNDNKRERIRQSALQGMATALKRSNYTQYFCLGPCTLNVPIRQVEVAVGETFHIRCVLTEDPDPDRYALASLDTDDAARLLIRIQGANSDGVKFDGMVQTCGERYVYKANTLYDILAGRSLEESRKLPRRWFVASGPDGSKTTTYTD